MRWVGKVGEDSPGSSLTITKVSQSGVTRYMVVRESRSWQGQPRVSNIITSKKTRMAGYISDLYHAH